MVHRLHHHGCAIEYDHVPRAHGIHGEQDLGTDWEQFEARHVAHYLGLLQGVAHCQLLQYHLLPSRAPNRIPKFLWPYLERVPHHRSHEALSMYWTSSLTS